MRKLAIGLMGAAACALTACRDPLAVTDANHPDVIRAFATLGDIEHFVQTGYQTLHKTLYNSATAITPEADATALETYATVANNGMNLRASIPRQPVKNDRGNATSSETYNDYLGLQKLARMMGNAIAAEDKLTGAGLTLGSTSQNLRTRAWAFLIMGMSLADVALV